MRLVERNTDRSEEARSESARDVDRITYSEPWRRLAGVTQVISPFDAGLGMHNRLTHSEKVAQVARSIALNMLNNKNNLKLSKELGGIDLHVCEAASLAHDFGHPPFGHIGEKTLDSIALKDVSEGGLGLRDGFEGNAQSFRILTQGFVRSTKYEGLNLTCATLAAVAKYPWKRIAKLDEAAHKDALKSDPAYSREWRKFNAYEHELPLLQKARKFVEGRIGEKIQTLEASIMDVADDISYAIHDLEDFHAAGIVDFTRVRDDLQSYMRSKEPDSTTATSNAFTAAEERLRRDYNGIYSDEIMINSCAKVCEYIGEAFSRSPSDYWAAPRAREKGSDKIGEFIRSVYISDQQLWDSGPHLGLKSSAWHEVQILKIVTKQYIIARPDIALIQRGQQQVLIGLVQRLAEWVYDPEERDRLPTRLRWEYENALRQEKGINDNDTQPRGGRNRIIIDYICSLTDRQCLNLYAKLHGSQIHQLGELGVL